MSEQILHDIQDDDGQDNFVEASEDDLINTSFIVEEKEPVIESNQNEFVDYVRSSIDLVPQHEEKSPNSLRRAIAYYENLQDQIHNSVANDADKVDLSMEEMGQLDQLDQTIDRKLGELKDKLGVKAIRVKTTKTASGKSADFTYVVPPFVMAIARMCINAKVTNGKDIEDIYQKLHQKYGMNEREKLEVLQVIADMGYPIRSSFMGDEDMIQQFNG